MPMSTPRLNGGSCLHSSDPTSSREHTHAPNLHNSFSELQWQFDPQKSTGPQSGPKSLGTDDSTSTFVTTKFYPGEIPFRSQGMSLVPPQHAEPVGTQTTPVSMPRESSGTQTSPPRVHNTQSCTQTMENNPHSQILVKEVRERLHKIVKIDQNHN